MHKNLQRGKIIHGMRPIKCKDRLKGNFPLAECNELSDKMFFSHTAGSLGTGFCCGGRLGMATSGVWEGVFAEYPVHVISEAVIAAVV